MILKKNFLETLSIISFSTTFICILLHSVSNISPVRGVFFPIYVFILAVISAILSFKLLQWLLQLNKPLKYQLLLKEYQFLNHILPNVNQSVTPKIISEFKEYDTNELSVISTVLERRLVSSWYVTCISPEIGFPFACKQILDQMIGKAFKICHKINSKDVYIDLNTLLITHFKEYKKTIKRHQKSPQSSIEELYKYTHINDQKSSSENHCTNILRLIIKELVPWELWDTPHSELLVRILSQKLKNYIDSTLSDPKWLMNVLFRLLSKTNEVLKEKSEESNEKVEVAPPDVSDNSVLDKEVSEDPIIQLPSVDDVVEPKLRQRRGRQGRNEVKIYDRIIEGSIKTWDTDIDLQCISLGQDLLASLDGDLTISRLWEQDTDNDSPKKPPSSPRVISFGDDDLDLELCDSPQKSPSQAKFSPKPGEVLRDIQATVHNAKTRIGDLQVDSTVDGDEAAGVMEGLLDFGIAGFKKGLRFTGLSDDLQERDRNQTKERSHDKFTPMGEADFEVMNVESGTFHKDENNSSAPPLLKQHRVSSQDSMLRSRSEASEPITMPSSSSPEPQYEEVTDLSTSIAKLRSLLQARSDDSICWSGAEETKGRIQTKYFDRPVDAAAVADEFDMATDSISPNHSTNNLPRLEKLFQRTVTGVFNSLRTAVGGEEELPNGNDGNKAVVYDWSYLPTSVEGSVSNAVGRLISSRRAYTHVDAALDSLEHYGQPDTNTAKTPQDEFDDLCESRRYCLSMCALELASSLGLLQSHVAHRLTATFLYELTEPHINNCLQDLSERLKCIVFDTFQKMSEDECETECPEVENEISNEQMKEILFKKIPVPLQLFGEETLAECIDFALSSFEHKSINKDLILRVLDVFAVHFKSSSIRVLNF